MFSNSSQLSFSYFFYFILLFLNDFSFFVKPTFLSLA